MRDGEQGQLADALPAHGVAPAWCRSRHFVPTSESHHQKTSLDLVPGHAQPIVADFNAVGPGINVNVDLGGVGVPGVGYSFGQDSRYMAVEIEAQMLQYIQTELHLQRCRRGHEKATRCDLTVRAMARAIATGTALPIMRPSIEQLILLPGGTNAYS